jgi:hypothetical protein
MAGTALFKSCVNCVIFALSQKPEIFRNKYNRKVNCINIRCNLK